MRRYYINPKNHTWNLELEDGNILTFQWKKDFDKYVSEHGDDYEEQWNRPRRT